MDGTLVDSTDAIIASLRSAIQAAGLRPPSRNALRFRLSESPGAILRSFGLTTTSLFDREFSQRLDGLRPCHPDLPATLDRLHGVGLKIGVVTSLARARANAMLQATSLSDLVDCLVAYGDTARHKPDPDPIHTACARLGCESSEAIAVGDMERDIVAAVRAGCLAVGVSWGVDSAEDLTRAGAAWIIGDPVNLLDYASRS